MSPAVTQPLRWFQAPTLLSPGVPVAPVTPVASVRRKVCRLSHEVVARPDIGIARFVHTGRQASFRGG